MDSLMAYGSSDEESDHDEDVPQLSTKSTNNSAHSKQTTSSDAQPASNHIDMDTALDPPISDEEDDFKPGPGDQQGFQLPPPKNATESMAVKEEEEPMESSNFSLLSGLPKPKADMVSTFADSEETELEEFVKAKETELKATDQKPPPVLQAKKRKTVQITVPELPVDSDEEDEPSTKKAAVEPSAQSKSKCGLFAVLPAPKNFPASKETGKKFMSSSIAKSTVSTEPSSAETTSTPSNKTLLKSNMFLPASLTRKSNISSKSAFNLDTGMMMVAKTKPNVKPVDKGDKSEPAVSSMKESLSSVNKSDEVKTMTLLPGVPADDSDEEEEGTSNFFSLGSEDSKCERQELSASSYVATASVSSLPAVSKRKEEGETVVSEAGPSMPQTNEPLTFSQTAGPEVQDAPLQFKRTTMANAYTGGQKLYGPMAGFSGGYGEVGASNAQYNYAGLEDVEMQEGGDSGMDVDDQPAQEDLLKDQEFLKLQGKGKRGKEEISFIDVHQDDQISDVNVVKNLSEESSMMSHSKKKNKDMPSSQQKRKHQITYLAFRAKEREIELKNQWADNRSTKKQTQAKYGF